MSSSTGRRYKVSDQELLGAVPEATHLADLLRRLGMAPYGGNYATTRARLRGLGVDAPRFQVGSRASVVQPEELAAAVSSATSWNDVIRRLGLPSGSTRRVRSLCQHAGLDTSRLARGGPGGVRAAPLTEVRCRSSSTT